MTTFDIRSSTSRLAAALARRWRDYADRRRRLRGAMALQALSDHVLKDCGISRSEIYSVALHGRHRSVRR